MKHYRWLSLLLAITLAFIGCGDDDDDVLELPSAEPVAYVVNQLALTVSSFNTATEEIQKDIYNVGNAPNDVEVRGNSLYVINTLDSNLQIIDLDTGVSDFVDLGEGSSPEKMAFVNDTTVYVTAGMANSVKVIDLAGKSVVKEIPVGTAPWGVEISQGKAYVVNSNYDFANFVAREGSVSVIDIGAGEVIQTIDVGVNSQEIALDTQGRLLVLCTGNYGDVMGSIIIIDPATDTASAPVDIGTIPSGIAVRDDGVAFITFSNFLTGESGLLSFDTNSGALTHSVASPLIPGIAGMGMATDSNNRLYIAVPDWDGSSKDKLLILDENDQLIGTHEIGDGGGAASFVAVRE